MTITIKKKRKRKKYIEPQNISLLQSSCRMINVRDNITITTKREQKRKKYKESILYIIARSIL